MAKPINSCTDMSKIQACDVTECAYNIERNCHAIAITVGNTEAARCDTFYRHKKGGVKGLTGGVGACKMSDCKFNTDLECYADAIKVATNGGEAVCKTFARR
jgi:hypothetical protein